MKTDEDYIRRCLELGSIASERGDAPVGSLIVVDRRIIAEGIESVKAKRDPAAHAEIEAIRIACEKLLTLDLSAAALYTNVEPCVMCAFAIRQTGIRRVVFGILNMHVGGANSMFAVLTDSAFPAKFAPPEIQAGVLTEECKLVWNQFQQSRI